MHRVAVSLSHPPVGAAADADLSGELVRIGRRAGLHSVGVARAEVFEETRRDLQRRKAEGLHAGMQFTYRNPDRSTDPGRVLPGARSLVVGAWSYRQAEYDGPAPSPGGVAAGAPPPGVPGPAGVVARYARSDHYGSLRRALAAVAGHLRAQGWRATVVCDDNALVDRAAAHRAGLGWFGRNTLLLLPGAGSWFVLGSVVTDADLSPTRRGHPSAHAEGCGNCHRCLTACPTGALVAPGVLDARRCLAWLVQAPGSFPEEFRAALGGRVYGCDECQQVCPVNRTADRRDPPPAEPAGEGSVDLIAMLEAGDEQLLAVYGRWYIPGRDPRYLRRNALVALGNVGDGEDPATVRVLQHWLGDGDRLLAEHAAWAAKALGRDDLVATGP